MVNQAEWEQEEFGVLPVEKLDRLDRKNFRRYMVENPFYAQEVFGFIPTIEELDKFIENNKALFYEDAPIYRRRLE